MLTGMSLCRLFICRLRVPRRSAPLYCEGRVGRMDGWDGEQKGPLIFFILRYIKHYAHIYLHTKQKLSGQFFFCIQVYMSIVFNISQNKKN